MSRIAAYAPDEYTSYSSGPSPELIREQQEDSWAENPTCIECGERFADLDIKDPGDGTCWYCLHPDCADGFLCQECLENAADRHVMDMER
jgi:hypothetical protein